MNLKLFSVVLFVGLVYSLAIADPHASQATASRQSEADQSRSVQRVAVYSASDRAAIDFPTLVSPGMDSEAVAISDNCPTFSWAPVSWAEKYELVIAEVDPSETFNADDVQQLLDLLSIGPILRISLPPSSSWTPSLSQCLETGRGYIWSIQATNDGDVAMADPLAFRVPKDTSPKDIGVSLQNLETDLKELRTSLLKMATNTSLAATVPLSKEGAPVQVPDGETWQQPLQPMYQPMESNGEASLAIPEKVSIKAEAESAGVVSYGLYGSSQGDCIIDDELGPSEGCFDEWGSAGVVGESKTDYHAGVKGISESQWGTAGVFQNTAGGAILETWSALEGISPFWVLADGGTLTGRWVVNGGIDIDGDSLIDERSSFTMFGTDLNLVGSYGRGGTGTPRLFVDGIVEISGIAPQLTVDGPSTFTQPVNVNSRLTVENHIVAQSLNVEDEIWTPVLHITGGSDLAEWFHIESASGVKPGTLVSIDPEHLDSLRPSSVPYDTKIAGIVSGAGGLSPGITLSKHENQDSNDYLVALAGRAWCLADAEENGPIQPGDMLTTSSTTGHAMKATDRSRAYGATIGKAMSFLEQGKGLVLVLVDRH